jgi:hypothetical protein
MKSLRLCSWREEWSKHVFQEVLHPKMNLSAIIKITIALHLLALHYKFSSSSLSREF